MLAMVTLLMVLSPASGAVAQPSVTLTAPYKGTISSSNHYVSVSGCAATKLVTHAKWTATTGVVATAESAKAHTCTKSVGTTGAFSSGYVGSGISIAIPVRVPTNGNHVFRMTWTLSIASTIANSKGGCPASKVKYPPPHGSYEYSYCEAGSYRSVYLSGSIIDLNNASWSGNYSYADAYNDTYWENFTDCYNSGTPTCSNTTGTHGYGATYGYNEKGAIGFSGTSRVTMWDNGTAMKRSHHYVLEISISAYAEAFADAYNLVSYWSGSAGANLNMGTLGNGARLSAVVIT